MGIHLYTAGTPSAAVETTLASQGGLLINIDSATGDIASTTTNTWLENNTALGLRNIITAGASNEADTAVTRTGIKTLKLSTTNATGLTTVAMLPDGLVSPITGTIENGFVVKPSTKYKLSCWVKTNNVAAASTYIRFTRERNASGTIVGSNADTATLSGTNDWTLLTCTKTTAATAVYSSIFLVGAGVTGNTGDAWFDINSMTLEEVVEPVANSLTSSSPSLTSFTAVGSTDNIDQSLDPTFVAVNTYTPPIAISETATNKQTFIPTKSKCTRIGVYPVAKGTGNWTVTVHDASNVVQATITIANASLTNGVVNYFNVPCNLTALGTYHFHVTSTVADGTVRVATATDLETVSYIQNYYKPTTNFKASQNNQSVSISSDEDGFLDGSVINLTTGAFSVPDLIHTSWTGGALAGNSYTGNDVRKSTALYSATSVVWSVGGTTNIISPTSATETAGYVVKFQGLNFQTLTTSVNVGNTGGTNIAGLAYSYDGTNYTEFRQINDDTEGNVTVTSTIDVTGHSTVYISLYRVSGSDLRVLDYSFSGTVNVSSYSTLRNYPTNKDIIKQYTKTLGSATTTATYRATKWGFPAIEYSATEYQFLDVDTTATGSTVAFSELGVSFTTVADGASLTISSTSTPSIFVKANITANRLYLSSNDYNAVSDKDGSNKQSVVYQVKPNPQIAPGNMNSNIKLFYG